METIRTFIKDYLVRLIPSHLTIPDVVEILILSWLIYNLIKFVKTTRAWTLMKGLAFLLVCWMIANLFHFNAIIWIFVKGINVGILAVVIIFQPEFRKALEQLGQKNIVSPLFSIGESKEKPERFSDLVLSELVRATFELAKTKTGALIVIEQEVSLKEYEQTGITLDAAISSQLLINIFEHNTPLHDGAVIIRGDRIVSATCYLPLSDNMRLSKDLGTRHRAGVGISEVTDSFTIIVSEETGKVSIAKNGQLIRSVDGDYLRAKLHEVQQNHIPKVSKKLTLWRNRKKNEKDTD